MADSTGKHTGGEWRVRSAAVEKAVWAELHQSEYVIVQRGDDVVAMFWDADDGGHQEAIANAELFLAAPGLLAVIRAAEQQIDYGQTDEGLRILRAAILDDTVRRLAPLAPSKPDTGKNAQRHPRATGRRRGR